MKYNYTFPALDTPVHSLQDDFYTHLSVHGRVLINVGTQFTNSDFFQIMTTIGTPMEENAVDGDYVEDAVVLNLTSKIHLDISSANEPFSVNALAMHVERAFSPLEKQPNFIALYCLQAPRADAGGQTIVYPMEEYTAHFTPTELNRLSQLRVKMLPDNTISPRPIYCKDAQRNIFYMSFRDPGPFGETWTFAESHDASDSDLADKLLRSLYDLRAIYSLRWEPGYLYIIDNKKNFHGRTEQSVVTDRHLKRIRAV